VSRASRPAAVSPRARIYDYGLIGNLHTAALASRFGSIDWACLPHFASPSVFGRLLDWDAGGFAEIRPVGHAEGHQRYCPGTNILETTFRLPGRRSLTVTDFMPIHPLRPALVDPRIVRILEAAGGPVPVEARLEPRFGYAARPARWTHAGDRWMARGRSGELLRTAFPAPARALGGALVSRFTVRPEERQAVELTWASDPDAGGEDRGARPEELLLATSTYWGEWTRQERARALQVAGPWRVFVERSELLLKLLSYSRTGAFIAAPTTSLPEWPGGTRNWDYRYVWIRDAAFTTQILELLGHVPEALGYLQWVIRRIDAERARPNGHLRVLYDARGAGAPRERELSHLAGYWGARPVRVGNDASSQLQLDIFGEVIDAAAVFLRHDPELLFLRSYWSEISGLADAVCELWRRPDQGMWESRGAPAEYLHSKVMCWVALHRAVQLGQAVGERAERTHAWRKEASAIRAFVLDELWDEEQGCFIQAVGRKVVDASALRIPLVEFLPFDDPRVLSTVRAVERELTVGPFVYRYRTEDGIPGDEGSFLLCAFWLVECLARGGRRRDALRNFRALLKVASPLALFSEEYDPHHGVPLGNYPQAFTHIGLLRATLALGPARHALRRRKPPAGGPRRPRPA
jgi:GH15 family glucan-1,4-alpha-glucosidase